MKLMCRFLCLLLLIITTLNTSCRKEESEFQGTPPEERIQLGSQVANLLSRTAMNDGSYDNILDNASCISVKFPVNIIVNNIPIEILSSENFNLIQDIFQANVDDEDIVEIQFPATIIFADHTEVAVSNAEDFQVLVASCGGENQIDDDIECVDFKYPIVISLVNIASGVIDKITLDNDKNLFHFVKDLKENDVVTLNFPVTVILSDGVEVVVADQSQLENTIETYKDDCDEEDNNDYLTPVVNPDDLDNDGIITALDCDDSDNTIGVAATWYQDLDGDGLGNALVSLVACNQPVDHVTDNTDVNDDDFDNDGFITAIDCDDTDNTIGVNPTWYQDLDGDGLGNAGVSIEVCSRPVNYVSDNTDANDDDFDNDGFITAIDCDDTDNTIGASITWYQDLDGDGLGNAGVSIEACIQPVGHVADNTDANDDDFDNDGFIKAIDCDDTDNTIGASITWYQDLDGDGLGNAVVSIEACIQPVGHVADNTDANDDDFDNDGIITAIDCDDTDNTIGASTTWYQDLDGDGLGNAVVSIEACIQPVGYVPNNTDLNDDDFDNDGFITSIDCDDTDNTIGLAVTWYQDLDGDGLGNALVSLEACLQPLGYVADNTDPNDSIFGNIWSGCPQWKVYEMKFNLLNLLILYEEYLFTFQDDGTIIVVSGLDTFNGTWVSSVSGSDTIIDIVIVGLPDFNGSWILDKIEDPSVNGMKKIDLILGLKTLKYEETCL